MFRNWKPKPTRRNRTTALACPLCAEHGTRDVPTTDIDVTLRTGVFQIGWTCRVCGETVNRTYITADHDNAAALASFSADYLRIHTIDNELADPVSRTRWVTPADRDRLKASVEAVVALDADVLGAWCAAYRESHGM